MMALMRALLVAGLVSASRAWVCRKIPAAITPEPRQHQPLLHSFPTKPELGLFLAHHMAEVLIEATERTAGTEQPITVAISGGSLPGLLALGAVRDEGLQGNYGSKIAWKRVFLFMVDERLVPLDDPVSNFFEVAAKLEDLLYVPSRNVHPVKPELGPTECAKEYEQRLKQVFGEGAPVEFDLVLLGMGPDGHTASLFPGHKLLGETTRMIVPIADSPKPPSTRVTMTLPLLNAARHVFFVCTGAGKAGALKRVFQLDASDVGGNAPMHPAGRVSGQNSLLWFVDHDAAGEFADQLERCAAGTHHIKLRNKFWKTHEEAIPSAEAQSAPPPAPKRSHYVEEL